MNVLGQVNICGCTEQANGMSPPNPTLSPSLCLQPAFPLTHRSAVLVAGCRLPPGHPPAGWVPALCCLGPEGPAALMLGRPALTGEMAGHLVIRGGFSPRFGKLLSTCSGQNLRVGRGAEPAFPLWGKSKEAKVMMSGRAAGSLPRGLWFKWNHISAGE